jgi:hypothetical protein
MKNQPRGKRNNAPSPYVKYDKTPYRYSSAYYAWRRSITGKAAKIEELEAEQRERRAQARAKRNERLDRRAA